MPDHQNSAPHASAAAGAVTWFPDFVNAMDDGVSVVEVLFDADERATDFRYLMVNAAFTRQTGLHDVVGRTMRELVPTHEQHWYDTLGGVALTGEPVHFEHHAEALGHCYEVRAFRVGHPDEHCVGTLFRCVDEQRATAAALRDSRERLTHQRELLENIVDTVPVMLVIWDPAQQRFTLNRHAEEVLGWTSEEANDGDFMARVYPDPDYRRQVSDYMASLAPGWREWTVTARDGSQVTADWANVRLTDDTMVGIGVDLRERKAAEQQILALNRDLERRVDERTAALRMNEHKLRDLAVQLADAQDAEQERIGEALHEDVSQLLAACQLKLAVAEAGEDDALGEAANLLAEAGEKVRLMSFELGAATLRRLGLGAALAELADSMALRHGLQVRVITDDAVVEPGDSLSIILYKATRELLFNVAKHAGTSEATVVVEADDCRLSVAVEDGGVGFAPTAGAAVGALKQGLGLFGIRQRLACLGGSLHIESDPGRRTRLTMTVPRTRQQPARAGS